VEDLEHHRHPHSHYKDSEDELQSGKEAGSLAFAGPADSTPNSHSSISWAPRKALTVAQQSYGKLKASDSSVPGAQDANSVHTADTDTIRELERETDSDNDSLGSSGSDQSATSHPSRSLSEKTVDQSSSTFSMISDRVNESEHSGYGQLGQDPIESPNSIVMLGRHPTELQLVPPSLRDRDSNEASEMTSTSMPDLMNKMEGPPIVQFANTRDEKAMISAFSTSSSQRDSNRGGVNGENDDNDESDGLISGSWDDRALLTPEMPERNSPIVQTLRPVQVRKMPMLFHVLMILCISMIGFGSYAGYDAVAAVQEALMKDMNLTPSQFSLLYSVYALPNIVLVIFGGKLVDLWGSHVVGLITTTSIAIGAGLVAIAPSLHFFGWYGRFGTMLIGRFIFGVGAESSYVVQNSMCVKWFFGDRLATAMAITVAFTRLGSICSFLFAPGLAARSNYTLALWAATGACILSLMAVFGYMSLRSYAKKYLLTNDFDANSLETVLPSDIEYPSRNSTESVELQSMDTADDTITPLDSHELDMPVISSGNCLMKELKLTWHHVRNFSSLFWGCAFLGMFTYGISLGFRAASSDSIATRYHLTPAKANLVLASIDITGLFASPVIGWLVDYTYQMGWITMVGNVLSVLTFLLLLPLISPYPATILLGISSTIVPATIYPAISYLIPPSLEGFAFGVTSSVINAGNLLLNHAISRTLDAGWFYMCYFLIFLSVISVALTLWWIIKDSKAENPILNRFRDWTPERQWLRRHLPFLFA
jgi:MFS family permease